MKFTIVFDGGSRGNPGPAYGSYHIEPWASPRGTTERLHFGVGTNNQSEYLALIAALRTLRGFLDGMGRPAAEAEVVVRGDSQLVLSQLAGEWKVKNATLKELHAEASRLLRPFGKVRFVHQDRAKTVELLGH